MEVSWAGIVRTHSLYTQYNQQNVLKVSKVKVEFLQKKCPLMSTFIIGYVRVAAVFYCCSWSKWS